MGLPVADDLEAAVKAADVICTCTMATAPLIKGEWLQPGQHLDLIGAYRPDMREVDECRDGARPGVCRCARDHAASYRRADGAPEIWRDHRSGCGGRFL
jgi:hypothetical protein